MAERESRARLGRGLASLFGDDVGDPAPATLHLDQINPGPFQPRAESDAESLRDLELSIRRHGVLQPILVRPDPANQDQFQIIAGERRWRAAQAAGLVEIPVILRDLSDHDAMAAGLIENLQRRDLNALEEAEGYRRLVAEFTLTQEQAAATVGKSRSHVANSLRLLGLPEPVKHLVRQGLLSAGHARAALAHNDPEWAARTIIARDLNVREAERLTQRPSAGQKNDRSSAAASDKTTMTAFEERLSLQLGLRVRIEERGVGGVIRIDYEDLDQLDGVVRLLTGD